MSWRFTGPSHLRIGTARGWVQDRMILFWNSLKHVVLRSVDNKRTSQMLDLMPGWHGWHACWKMEYHFQQHGRYNGLMIELIDSNVIGEGVAPLYQRAWAILGVPKLLSPRQTFFP